MTRRKCPRCKGNGIVIEVPNAMFLYPALAGPVEEMPCACIGCRATGFQIGDPRTGIWNPDETRHIIL